jgi:hypothetical protein
VEAPEVEALEPAPVEAAVVVGIGSPKKIFKFI